ncbi:MAG TPA: carbohydrate-binding family V/XII, partial [Burkholderiales bacterium]|nr:carbohydrate-binding family V/XII [Burkholderiales bacterium]
AQGANAQAQTPADPWPRDIQLSNAVVTVYQPQVEKWEGDTLQFRAAVAAKPSGNNETFGVIWGEAHTEVDRVARMVTLSGMSLTRIKFPTLNDNGSSYLRELRQHLPNAARTIELDRLQASLAANGQVRSSGVPVRNDAPRIIVSNAPAVLIPIAGDPVLKGAADTRFERVLNTRALILRDGTTYYLHLYDGWMSAPAVDGPWRPAGKAPLGMDQLATDLAKSGQVDLLDGGNVQPKASLAKTAPTVYVSHIPAELIVFDGQPKLQPVSGTGLLWATNTIADVLVDTTSNDYYVLISGRWYQARSLEGPWGFVASNALPADFARIPRNEPAARVLASVAGTPQAQEALIENSIPQTAAVPRANGPKFTPTFDGAPQLRPVEGTPLHYVVNSPDAIVQANASSYYAVQSGIWFAAARLTGPWEVAATVPAVIYTIPTSSPLHYVTYVQVYRTTPTTVYVGYTQGYLGTVVASDGVVVYGTGYPYSPWVGSVYYAVPVTYGVAAYPAYDAAAGMMLGFAFGATTAAMVAPHWGPYYGGFYAGGGCCWGASASQNVYGHWGNTVASGTRTYGYNPSTGNVGVRGSYSTVNTRTGTISDVQTGRGYNPVTGERSAGYERSAVNPNTGASGTVARGAEYNPQTGTATRGAAGTVNAPSAGVSATGQRESATNAYGQHASESSGTVTDTRTGQSASYKSASAGNDHYADVNGNVYKNTGSGWEKNTGSGWENARPEESSSMAKEQQARSEGEQRANSFDRNASEGRFRGGGGFRGRR